LLQTNKCKILWFDLLLQRSILDLKASIFDLKVLIFDLKVYSHRRALICVLVFFSWELQMLPPLQKRRSWFKSLIFRGREHVLYYLFCSLKIYRCLLLVEREGLDLECWSLRLRARLCACSLHSGSSILFLFF